MIAVQFSGTIRPDVMTEESVLDSTFNLVKFLEINGESNEAREYLRMIEQLESIIKNKNWK